MTSMRHSTAPRAGAGRSERERAIMGTTLESELREDFPEGKGVSAPVPVLLAYVEAWLADAEHGLSLEGRVEAAGVVRELRERWLRVR
jgi:hypothetical protein